MSFQARRKGEGRLQCASEARREKPTIYFGLLIRSFYNGAMRSLDRGLKASDRRLPISSPDEMDRDRWEWAAVYNYCTALGGVVTRA